MRNSRFEMQGKQSLLQVHCKLELLMRVDVRVFIYLPIKQGIGVIDSRSWKENLMQPL